MIYISFGLSIWPVNLACQFGLSIWPVNLACQFGLPIKRDFFLNQDEPKIFLLWLILYVYILAWISYKSVTWLTILISTSKVCRWLNLYFQAHPLIINLSASHRQAKSVLSSGSKRSVFNYGGGTFYKFGGGGDGGGEVGVGDGWVCGREGA